VIGGRTRPGNGADSLRPVTNGAERTRWKIRFPDGGRDSANPAQCRLAGASRRHGVRPVRDAAEPALLLLTAGSALADLAAEYAVVTVLLHVQTATVPPTGRRYSSGTAGSATMPRARPGIWIRRCLPASSPTSAAGASRSPAAPSSRAPICRPTTAPRTTPHRFSCSGNAPRRAPRAGARRPGCSAQSRSLV
jgi:hypothetical protein